jgi:putative phosphatase
MLLRAIYCLTNARSHIGELYRAMFSESIAEVSDINDALLSRKQFSVLALDFDGVLAPHGYPEPSDIVKQWLNDIVSNGGFKRIYIYSNKPSDLRRIYFETHHPEVIFISNVRKKPYPDGLLKIIEMEEVPPKSIAMVDDRLLTGILASIIAGTSSLFITHPLIDYSHNTTSEIFFSALRFVEKKVVNSIGRIIYQAP